MSEFNYLSIGIITPDLNWQPFPVLINSVDLLRAKYTGDFTKIISHAWLRAFWYIDGLVYTSRNWVKLYPKPEYELIEYKLIDNLYVSEFRTYGLEIKKSYKYLPAGQRVQDDDWSIELEEMTRNI